MKRLHIQDLLVAHALLWEPTAILERLSFLTGVSKTRCHESIKLLNRHNLASGRTILRENLIEFERHGAKYYFLSGR